MAVRELPYRSLHRLIRDHLSREEDADAAALIQRLRPARHRGYLTTGELRDVCRWKSPRAAGLVRLNDHRRVRKATGTALRATSELERIHALVTLQGVSVPTASAILTMLNPERYGVIDIRVWQLLHGLDVVDGNPGGTKLTAGQWERFLALIRGLAATFGVSARNIERTLFLAHRRHQNGRLYASANGDR